MAGALSSRGGGEISYEMKEGSRPTNKDCDLSPESYKEPLRYLNRIGFKNMMGCCKNLSLQCGGRMVRGQGGARSMQQLN